MPEKTKTPKISQCGKCGLYKKAVSPKIEVQGEGKHKILFVIETPDEMADRTGSAIEGDEGQFLLEKLYEIDKELTDCYITHAVICKAPKIEPYMISCCRPNLLKRINEIKPNVIIPLGSAALKSILYQEWPKDPGTIGKWIGWNIPSPKYNAWICPTYDLKFILEKEEPQIINEFKNHLKNAFKHEKRKVKSYNLEELKNRIELIPNPRKGNLRMKELSNKKGVVAFDYETNGLKPDKKGHKIISCSFCLNGKDTFATMIDESNQEMLSRILRNPNLKKVASNLKFEERWTRAIFGHGVRGWVWDTMLASHCLDNRPGICSIKFQAFIYMGISDYASHISSFLTSKNSNGFNTIEKLDKKQLLIYNGLDSLLEYIVANKQRRIFNG